MHVHDSNNGDIVICHGVSCRVIWISAVDHLSSEYYSIPTCENMWSLTMGYRVLQVTAPTLHDGVMAWKHFPHPWWRHQMETFSALMGILPVSDAELRCFIWSAPKNKRLSKQPWGWWFETPSWSLWRHGNALALCERTPLMAGPYRPWKRWWWVQCCRNLYSHDVAIPRMTLLQKCNFCSCINDIISDMQNVYVRRRVDSLTKG